MTAFINERSIFTPGVDRDFANDHIGKPEFFVDDKVTMAKNEDFQILNLLKDEIANEKMASTEWRVFEGDLSPNGCDLTVVGGTFPGATLVPAMGAGGITIDMSTCVPHDNQAAIEFYLYCTKGAQLSIQLLDGATAAYDPDGGAGQKPYQFDAICSADPVGSLITINIAYEGSTATVELGTTTKLRIYRGGRQESYGGDNVTAVGKTDIEHIYWMQLFRTAFEQNWVHRLTKMYPGERYEQLFMAKLKEHQRDIHMTLLTGTQGAYGTDVLKSRKSYGLYGMINTNIFIHNGVLEEEDFMNYIGPMFTSINLESKKFLYCGTKLWNKLNTWYKGKAVFTDRIDKEHGYKYKEIQTQWGTLNLIISYELNTYMPSYAGTFSLMDTNKLGQFAYIIDEKDLQMRMLTSMDHLIWQDLEVRGSLNKHAEVLTMAGFGMGAEKLHGVLVWAA